MAEGELTRRFHRDVVKEAWLALLERCTWCFDSQNLSFPVPNFSGSRIGVFRFKNFKEAFDGYKHKVGRDDGHCHLTVTNVGPDDCGEIECRAFNKEGNATIRAKLILQCE